MLRYRLTLAYDGSPFSGFQRQPVRESVQSVLEFALARVLGETITVIPSGRTDAGVHALAQPVHFDAHAEKSAARLARDDFLAKINGVLPDAIAVLACMPAPEFHARKAAKNKTYAYLILVAKRKNPFMDGKVWRLNTLPDLRLVRRAAKYLVGAHDFSAFCAADSTARDKTRRITRLAITLQPPAPFFALPDEKYMVISVSGTGFLKQMVRTIVGTLVTAGLARITPEQVGQILKSRDRRQAFAPAPAHGLYLENVTYDVTE